MYIERLIERKAAEPGNDLLSELVMEQVGDEGFHRAGSVHIRRSHPSVYTR